MLLVIVRGDGVSRNAVTYKGDRLLTWGGDATDKQGGNSLLQRSIIRE